MTSLPDYFESYETGTGANKLGFNIYNVIKDILKCSLILHGIYSVCQIHTGLSNCTFQQGFATKIFVEQYHTEHTT